MAMLRNPSYSPVGQWLVPPAFRTSAALLRNLPPPVPRHRRRSITNATKTDYIPSLLAVPRVAAKPGGWHPTLIHSSRDIKFTVIRLAPGQGEVPTHWHSHVWNYFVPLEGEAVIET
ncbi:hypothetical protein CLAFUW4_13386 [Fulvia fulva]|uniref:Uncharacterized protein n=1 Tax=Passalora fulva TaxID=5499 RepID=A0A9Q8PK48_PASFU|nr:uncharacterized protein CLAFUR5_13239 [Fulvia fulva]KAK4611524.1 hypothetical protein CLAFUR4_13390 [Fulvia fulva]KAK4613196.1 hypothetical protein CLAFUR0_13396 [Fulvia fulva]UJO23938.1 hypothetical protein CLAFUR5_13239 [Fulvia fulva]WPV21204.1 hypothetical protein CLAFUW4_13386 [Fulvia fulva]WPV35878.1 hypothetical protein CLAFUW7_13393 [Fulvia fulva]